ncbi:hypothetical protein F5Y09DRAFT_308251 [Xylaria sp. FL1042]|nr:hypothetical protein F5Y09DRAFT_308251 [Xylaria sp. FL1042]
MPAMAAYLTTMAAKYPDHLTQRAVTSSNRPNHQLRRSITEQSPPFRPSRVHQYLHRKDRERDDRLPLSAGPSGRGSLEFSRAEAATPAHTGMAFSRGDDVHNASEAGTNSQTLLSNNETAQERKERAVATTASLRRSLIELNSFSNATIARLDETYSSLLQRLGSLRSTIAAMKELAAMSQEINESFTTESHALVHEIESQLSVYDQSADQKKSIQDLQARIHAGRDKVQALSNRVDVVRERIEGWEKADKEWQERTRRRLKVIWIIISIVAFILAILFVGAQYTLSVDVNQLAEIAPDAQEGRPPMESLAVNNSKSAATMADEVREELTLRRAHGSVEQEALRVFDEL